MNLSISYITKVVGGKMSASANGNRIINGFYSDSRTPAEDKMFLAIRGERFDGNSFVPTLVSKGFAALTDEKENLSLSGDVIYVNNVTEALQILAEHYRITELSALPIVGITGSVGKTTTKEMVFTALSCEKNVYKTLGNFNSQIGLPQTVLYADSSFDCAVVELGMSFKGEMERISRCARPNISIITNIGFSHIENLGSRENIRNEKLKIAEFSNEKDILLLNGDEPLLADVNTDKTVYYVSVNNKSANCYSTDITEFENSVTFNAFVFDEWIQVKLNVIGKHFVLNSLFALATAKLLGLNLNNAAKALGEYKSDGKRQHIYESDGHTVISDCYNASPESMEAALSVLGNGKNRRVAVLADMLELGTCSEELHKRVGEYTANTTDVLITYGEQAKFISNASPVKEKYHFSESQRNELHIFLKEFIKPDDIVLYKGSNGMNLSQLIV